MAALLLFAFAVPARAIPSAPDSGWINYGFPFGSVEAFATHSDGRVFVGGGFDATGTYDSSGGVSRWGRVSQTYDPDYPHSSAWGLDVVSDGSGGTYWIHSGLSVDGVAQGYLVHITSGGVVDDMDVTFTGGTPTDFILDGTTLYVTGSFTAVNGTTRNRAAAINVTNGSLLSWDPVLNGAGDDVLVDGSWVYMTGSFTCVGGDGDATCGEAGESTRNRIARFHKTTGAVDTWDPVLNAAGRVMALNTAANLIYVAGNSLTCVGGDGDSTCGEAGESSRTKLAAFHTDDAGTVTSFNPIPSNTVISLLFDSGTGYLYVAGSFGCFGGDGDTTCGEVGETTRNRLARFNTADDSLMAWDPNPISSGSISAIYLYGTDLYYGFNAFGAVSTTDASVTWIPDGGWNGFYFPQGSLFVDADYVYAPSQAQLVKPEYTRSRLAAFAADGTVSSWNPNVTGGDVTEMAIDEADNLLYIAGTFTAVGGQTRNRLAAIDLDTGSPTSWDPNVNGTINTLVLDAANDVVYIGGAFTTVNGATTRNRLAAISTTGTGTATAWDPVTGGSSPTVSVLVQSGTTIYVGGSFTCVGGDGDSTCGEAGESTRNRIAAFSTSGAGAVTTWNPSATSGTVSTMALDGTTLYVGGTFTNIGGSARNRLAALSTTSDTNNATAWNPGSTAEPAAIALDTVQDYLYAGFSTTGVTVGGATQTTNGLFQVDLTINTSNATAWNPYAGGAIRSLSFANNALSVGGSAFLDTFGATETYTRFNFARFASYVSFASASGNGLESVASPAVTVTLGAADAETITVDYAVTGGTATGSGTDYTLASGTLTFVPNDTSETIPLSIVDDTEDDDDETVVITLSNPVNASLGAQSSFTYTITDDDVVVVSRGSSLPYTPPQPLFARSVSLLAPNGGERVRSGEHLPISWSVPAGRADYVNVSWSPDGGVTWNDIVRGAPNLGSYDWTVPPVSSAVSSGLVRVELSDLASVFTTDVSDQTFVLLPVAASRLPDVLAAHGLAWGGVARTPASSSVFFLDERSGTRRPFLDAQTYRTYFASFDGVATIQDGDISALPVGAPMLPNEGTVFVKVQSDPTVYLLEPNSVDHTRPVARPIPDEDTAARLAGPGWADYVIDLPVTAFPRLSIGVPASAEAGHQGPSLTRAWLNR